jgi:hypothetical protein
MAVPEVGPSPVDRRRHGGRVDRGPCLAQPAPFGLLVVLVVVLASNGPGSLMGFDYARTENEAERIGSAMGIVNVGGFVASLLTIALIGPDRRPAQPPPTACGPWP